MQPRQDRKPKKKSFWRPVLKNLALIAAAFFLITVLAVILVPIPEIEVPVATTVFDANNQVVSRLYVENRIEISPNEMPLYLKEAIVATEDYRFFEHHGIDFWGIARAVVRNIQAGRIVEGGSTITQQLAKNLYSLSRKRTIARKMLEAFLTLKLEFRYSKNEILGMYLNTIYFGHGAYGVEVASLTYFGKHARELTLPEAALLAGLPRSPEYYSPYNHPDQALARRNVVLDRMVAVGYLSPEAAEKARKTPIKLAGLKPVARQAQYFISYVIDLIAKEHPDVVRDLYRGGYQIYTTLDIKMQQAAERAIAENLVKGTPDAKGVEQPQVALVAVDPRNGYIKAMVGGRDYEKTPLNRAVQAHRQPGSAFKAFLYTAVIDSRQFTAASLQRCEPVSFPDGKGGTYEPADYGKEKYHYEDMTVRRAIAISDNVIAVKWANVIGPAKVIEYARRMGIKSPLEPSLPLVLGTSEVTPLEITAAYAPLANLGLRVEPISLLKVQDRYGNVIMEGRPRLEKVLNENVAYIVTDLFKSVLAPGGTGAALAGIIDRPAAGKTGTTDDLHDAWFIGFTPDLVGGVWVGNDDPSKPAGYGAALAGPIWANFMRDALVGIPAHDWAQPPGVVRVPICSITGLNPNLTCPVEEEVFLAGTEPKDTCPIIHWLPSPTPGPAQPPLVPGQPPLAPPSLPPGIPPAGTPSPGPGLPRPLDRIFRGRGKH